MGGFIVRRLLSFLLVLLALTVIVFSLVHLSGDPVVVMLQGTGASEQDLIALREELGYNKPAYVQYWEFMKKLVRGDMGKSLFYHVPALSVVLQRAPATIELAILAMLIAIAVGIPVGILSATKPGTLIDHLGMLLALLGQSVPSFWLAIMAVFLFAVRLGWLPAGGTGTPRHFVLPAMTLAIWPIARLVRITRSSMLEVMYQDYMTTARAKGLQEIYVIVRHALKNASLPVVTIGGLILGELLGGSVITETVFSWPGVGRLIVQAVYARDLRLVQATVFMVALGFLVCNLLVDILYAYLDPRIAYK